MGRPIRQPGAQILQRLQILQIIIRKICTFYQQNLPHLQIFTCEIRKFGKNLSKKFI